MYKFETEYKDDYGKLFEELECEIIDQSKKSEPRYYKKTLDNDDTVFFTEVDNDDYEIVHEVTPKFRKGEWKYTVVQK